MNNLAQLLKIANSGYFTGKKEIFYPFKRALLEKFGEFDGHSAQIIPKECYHYAKIKDYCPDCKNTAWFLRNRGFIELAETFPEWYDYQVVNLKRYKLDNELFLIPYQIGEKQPNLFYKIDYKNYFVGYVIHNGVSRAYLAAIRLYWGFNKKLILKHIKLELKLFLNRRKSKIKSIWWRWKMSLAQFKKNESDDVPF